MISIHTLPHLNDSCVFEIAGRNQCKCHGCDKEDEDGCTCECKAYNFDKLTLRREGGKVVVTNSQGKKATIVIENILASNGVIHFIDRVLY